MPMSSSLLVSCLPLPTIFCFFRAEQVLDFGDVTEGSNSGSPVFVAEGDKSVNPRLAILQ